MFSSEDLRKHNKVTNSTVKRVFKSGGFVLFDKEMAKPCTSIPGNQREGQKLKVTANNQIGNKIKKTTSANKMGQFGVFVLVFIDVERVKLFKICKFFFHNPTILTHHLDLSLSAASERRVSVVSQFMQASVRETPYFKSDKSSGIC